VRIFRQELHQVGFGHIRLVAHADEVRETHLLAQHQVHHPAHHRAGLRHEPDAAGIGHAINEGGVQARVQVDQPHAVGADHTHAITPDDLQAARLLLLPFRTHLLKSTRDDNHRLYPAFAAGFQRIRDGGHRQHDHRQVHGIRHC